MDLPSHFRKYRDKYSGENVASALSAVGDVARRRYLEASAPIYEAVERVRELLSASGVPSPEWGTYLAFAQRLGSKAFKLSCRSLSLEASALKSEWVHAHGADPGMLDRIIALVAKLVAGEVPMPRLEDVISVEKLDIYGSSAIANHLVDSGSVRVPGPGTYTVVTARVPDIFNSFCVDIGNSTGGDAIAEVLLDGSAVGSATVEPYAWRSVCATGRGVVEVRATTVADGSIYSAINGAWYVSSDEYTTVFAYRVDPGDVVKPLKYLVSFEPVIYLHFDIRQGERVDIVVNGYELGAYGGTWVVGDSVEVRARGRGYILPYIEVYVDMIVLGVGGFAAVRSLSEWDYITDDVILAKDAEECYNCLYYDKQIILRYAPVCRLVLVRILDKELEKKVADLIRECPDTCYQ